MESAADWAQIAVLGPVGIRTGVDDFTAVRGHQGALLAILAAHYPNAVEQEVVIDALWPVNAPSSAKGSLGVALHRLRNRLPTSNMIVTEGSTYRLDVEPEQLDASQFLALASRTSEDAAATADVLIEAVDLWRGRPFQPVGDDLAFMAVTSELLDVKRETEERLVDALLEAGRVNDAANRAARLVEAEPYRERRWELLMLALYRSSRQAEALRAAQRARQTLGDDLGLEPGPALQNLETAILNQDPSLVVGAPDAGAVGELVERRTQPETLPVFNSALVGRTAELADLATAIDKGGWVAVHGPPGVGKTCLLSHYCLGDSQRRTLWLDCAASEPNDVFIGLAQQLGVRPDEGERIDALVDALASESTLAVLDNPSEDVLSFLPRLASVDVSVVSLTREPMAIDANSEFAVAGLDNEAAAAILLAGSAISAEAAAAVIDEIGTTPLHVELFAAQLSFASVDELLDDWKGPVAHIDDQLARALDWSVERLTHDETGIYEQLGVHAGWCSTTDIAGVVGLPVGLVRKHLATLMSYGLARASRIHEGVGPVRYRLDLSMRSHATERLRERGGLGEARANHARYFAELAKQRGVETLGADEQTAVEHLHKVLPELHLALDYLVDAEVVEDAIDFVLALGEYAFFRLEFRTLDWVRRVAALPAAKDSPKYPELLATAGLSAWASDRLPSASAYADEAIAEAEQGDRPPPITALRTRLNVAAARREPETTTQAMVDFIEEVDRAGTDRDRSDCFVNQAIGATFVGDASGGMRAAIQSLDFAERTENPTSMAWAKFAVGCAELLRHPEPALVNFAESLRMARTVQNRWVVSAALGGVATAARLGGRAQDAADPLLSLLDIWIGLRKERYFARTLNEIALVLLDLEQPDAARTVLGWSRSYTGDPLLLPEDRARLRKATTELVPPLVTDLFDVREQARSAAELLAGTTATANMPDR